MLLFVGLYLLASIAVGLWCARWVHNTADYAVAGRALPLSIVIGTTFATWFGSETVLGIPARFLDGGLKDTVEDPWGASFCLILVGMFFARRLYRMSLLTISDYYHRRYGRTVEVFCSLVSMVSYLGWVAAQITALGLVFSVLTEGSITPLVGTFLGTGVVLLFTVFGGMWSVAVTDFIQMFIIVVGLAVIAVIAGNLAGGPEKVVELVVQEEMHHFWPPPELKAWLFFVGAGITIMLGSIPQQDVFQRVMSAKSEDIAAAGAMIGGVGYLLFSFVPVFIVASSLLIMPTEATALMERDPQQVLPSLIMSHMPRFTQVVFFGALLSAIMSTASSTILAPATLFVQNILKNALPDMNDRRELLLMRLTVLVFTAGVLAYSIYMHGTSIYDLVSSSYEVPVVGAFVPLVAGLYWRRSTNQGAITSIVFGVVTWIVFMTTELGEHFPQQLAGLLMAIVGMWLGSVVPTQGNRAAWQKSQP